MSHRLLHALPVIIALLLLTACDEVLDRLPGEGEEDVARALDSMQQGSLETALLAVMTGDIDIVDEESEMAEAAASLADTAFSPEGCAEGVHSGPTVTWDFDNCDAAFGLRNINGSAILVFSDSQLASTGVSLTATSITLNRQQFDVDVRDDDGDASAVSLNGSMSLTDAGFRQWDLISASGGLSMDGEPLSRTGNFSAEIDEDNCLQMTGGWNGTIRTDFFPTLFRNFTRCESTCPTAGTMALGEGEIDNFDSFDAISGDVLTMTFAGEERVAWVTTEGRAGATTLVCD